MRGEGLITVEETPEFLAVSRKLLDADQRTLLISYSAAHPAAGDLRPETCGLRNLPWALPGRGRRGGARVIYFLRSERLPLFLLTAYAKNERADLSAKDRAEFKKFSKQLLKTYRG